MKKTKLLGLILFANIIVAGLFLTTELLLHQEGKAGTGSEGSRLEQDTAENKADTSVTPTNTGENVASAKTPTGSANAPDTITIEEATAGFATDIASDDSLSAIAAAAAMPELIYNSSEEDYMSYIPEPQRDNELDEALDIDNPDISVDAEAAILFDAATKQVLYYKNPVKAVFPASTLKLLTAIVVLNWCTVDEEVTIGDEIKLIASDSTRAYLVQGEILTIRDLLEAMLLPSGNDAAYAVAAYVGRKSLSKPQASREEAVSEFIRLMNEKAKELGVKNSCFKTPDGYDAIGQYTTAYDMGLIGMAAAGYDTIVDIAKHSRISTTFISGEEVTWKNTNKLIARYSGEYYSHAIGLKTGTSTMAGRCIIAAAKDEDRKVVCVILDSTVSGRWEDAIRLMKYGLE